VIEENSSGNKTGQGHGTFIAMSGDARTIQALADLGIDRKIFLISHSNPALLRDSAERG